MSFWVYRELPSQRKVGGIFLRQLQGSVNGNETGKVEAVSFISVCPCLIPLKSIGLWRLNDIRGGKEMERVSFLNRNNRTMELSR